MINKKTAKSLIKKIIPWLATGVIAIGIASGTIYFGRQASIPKQEETEQRKQDANQRISAGVDGIYTVMKNMGINDGVNYTQLTVVVDQEERKQRQTDPNYNVKRGYYVVKIEPNSYDKYSDTFIMRYVPPERTCPNNFYVIDPNGDGLNDEDARLNLIDKTSITRFNERYLEHIIILNRVLIDTSFNLKMPVHRLKRTYDRIE